MEKNGQQKLIFGEVEDAYNRIEIKAADIQQLFDAFRQRQVEGDGSVPTEHKLKLKEMLKDLSDELDRYLAGEYGINYNNFPKKKEYEQRLENWRDSHQPLHWFSEFYGIIKSGGFDVIIGNPPYVEYRTVRDSYRLPPGQYASEPAENLYSYCMERSCRLLRPSGRFGMIVPTGVLGLDQTVSLRDVLLERYDENWCSTYSIRPSKLFDGVDQRLCIYIGTLNRKDARGIWSTRYHHWSAEERPVLFSRIEYARSFLHDRLKRIPQVGSPEATSVLQKIDLKRHKTVNYYFSSGKYGLLMHYHRSPRYWIRAMDFEAYFKSPTRSRSVYHFRDVYFKDKGYGKFIGALLNSTLFFFWFVSVGNGRNITGTDIEQIPVGEVNDELLQRMPEIFDRLMRDYDKNSFVRERKDCEFQEFQPSKSKPILDEIDRVLAQHYGFTDEELDFIINYDIKYRLGAESEE